MNDRFWYFSEELVMPDGSLLMGARADSMRTLR